MTTNTTTTEMPEDEIERQWKRIESRSKREDEREARELSAELRDEGREARELRAGMRDEGREARELRTEKRDEGREARELRTEKRDEGREARELRTEKRDEGREARELRAEVRDEGREARELRTEKRDEGREARELRAEKRDEERLQQAFARTSLLRRIQWLVLACVLLLGVTIVLFATHKPPPPIVSTPPVASTKILRVDRWRSVIFDRGSPECPERGCTAWTPIDPLVEEVGSSFDDPAKAIASHEYLSAVVFIVGGHDRERVRLRNDRDFLTNRNLAYLRAITVQKLLWPAAKGQGSRVQFLALAGHNVHDDSIEPLDRTVTVTVVRTVVVP